MLQKKMEEIFCRNIGVENLEEVNEWFRKDYQLYDAPKFCTEILKYKNKKVRIVGDYDGDGIFSTSIFFLGLKSAGFKHLDYCIPHRTDGFGLSEKIVWECIVDEVDLILTCDNGTASIDAIKLAKENGIAVIVTDHHQPVMEGEGDDAVAVYPNADLIINPSALPDTADFDKYCGAGIAYKLMCSLLGEKNDIVKKLSVMAGFATITDMMPLREENYKLVRKALKNARNPKYLTNGLNALLSFFHLHYIDEKDIGFKIGPVLNASERMNPGTAHKMVELVTSELPYTECLELAEQANNVNIQRKETQKKMMTLALDVIKEQNLENRVPLIVYLPNQKEGLSGIIAGNLADKYKVPTIVLTDSSNTKGVIKGSARSKGNCNMKEELDAVSHLLLSHGGHKEAGGLSLKLENLETFRECMEINLIDYVYEDECDMPYDLEISASQLPEVIKCLDLFKPFGMGNPNFRLKITDYTLTSSYGKYCTISPESKTIKLYSGFCNAIGFGMADKMGEIISPQNFSLCGVITKNSYMGKQTPMIEFYDFENHTKENKTLLAQKMASI